MKSASNLPLATPQDPSWQTRAECKPATSSDMFPDPPEGSFFGQRTIDEQTAIARFCAQCSVVADCLITALADKEQTGIRGGQTEQERRVVLGQIVLKSPPTSKPPKPQTLQHPEHPFVIKKGTPLQKKEKVAILPELRPAYYRPINFSTTAIFPEALDRFGYKLIEATNVLSQGYYLNEWGPFRDYGVQVQEFAYSTLCSRLGIGSAAPSLRTTALVHWAIEQNILPVQVTENTVGNDFDPQDLAVFVRAARGKSATEISRALDIQFDHVATSLKKSLALLGTQNLPYATRRAFEYGILPKEPAGDLAILPLPGPCEFIAITSAQAKKDLEAAEGNYRALL